ncbi:MAG: transcription factor S [Sulfolobales archaeon]
MRWCYTVEFCPKCGAMLVPQKAGTNTKTTLTCIKCGFKKEVTANNKYTLSQNVRHSQRNKTLVIEKSDDVAVLPKIKGMVTCPKCGSDEAYYWLLQTRRADEPPTRFYRCVKCNHVWREYE